MKKLSLFLFLFTFVSLTSAQHFIGIFEVGENVPFMLVSSDPETGMPTNPINLEYTIFQEGSVIASGTMTNILLGIHTGLYSTTGNTAGNYNILLSGLIGDVTTQSHKTYTLLPTGKGIASIADEVSGIDGTTPFTESAYTPYHNEIVSAVTSASQVTVLKIDSLDAKIESTTKELQIVSREHSRSRLWYAQSTIDSATRKVPADMPSHIEIQVAASEDILYASPLETFYRVYFYPNSLSATKPSREVRTVTPPIDGTFYQLPDIDW